MEVIRAGVMSSKEFLTNHIAIFDSINSLEMFNRYLIITKYKRGKKRERKKGDSQKRF